MDESVRVPESVCPTCGERLDACRAIGRRIPKEGDISLCINCSAILVFDKNLIMVKPDKNELAEIMANPDIAMAVTVTKLYQRFKMARKADRN